MNLNDLNNIRSMLLPYLPILIVVALWTIIWKGLALWHSARRGEWKWFVVLLIVNTLGILELIYLFVTAKVPFRGC